MVQAQIFTGRWEELKAHASNVLERTNLTLIVPAEEAGKPTREREHCYLTATPVEFEKVFDTLGHGSENALTPAQEASEHKNLYP